MLLMKRITILGLVGLLNACASQPNQASQAVDSAAKCPKPVASLPEETLEVKTQKITHIFDHFDYRPKKIVADANTVRFQAREYDFVFCRDNKTWTVQPGTLKEPLVTLNPYTEAELANPKLETIEFKGKTYQYRVILEPNPFSLNQPRVDAEKVIFELISPDSKAPTKQTLYTLKDLKQADVGSSLGIPRLTAATIHGDRIWWAVAAEQGEGNNGIATLVSYDPQSAQLAVIQPEKIKGQQIIDLAVTGDSANPTFWMGTMLSGEGNSFLPSWGLIAYRPDPQNPNSGSLTSYNVHNSPLVGAIPDKLKLDNDRLWVGTRNGACQLNWQAADNPESWSCWRFAAMAKLPTEGISLYSGLTEKTATQTLSAAKDGETVEVLWWMPVNLQTREGRYEVRHTEGFTFTLADQGAYFLPPDFVQNLPKWQAETLSLDWVGREWHWNGDRFVRGLDEVAQNLVGGGPRGIGSDQGASNSQINWKAIRGDLDLLKLSQKSTSVKYYSSWVDDDDLQPYPSVVPQERPTTPQPNPLKAIAEQLKTQ